MTTLAPDTKKPDPRLVEETYGPSVIEERPPEVARSVGVFGFFLLGGTIVMLAWNAIRYALGGPDTKLPFFSNNWIVFCGVTAVALLYYHAAFDRALEVRRAYGILAWLVLVAGGLGGLFWTVHQWWGTVAAILTAFLTGLISVAVTVCPWVNSVRNETPEEALSQTPEASTADTSAGTRSAWANVLTWPNALGQFLGRWNNLIGTDVVVTRITFGAAALVALALVVVALLVVRFQWPALPTASNIALILGLAFLMTAAKHESNEVWRLAASYVLAYAGYIAFAVLALYIVRDLVVTTDGGLFAPVGLLAGILSLLFLLAHINLAGTDADSSYYAATICLVFGALLLGLLSLLRALLPTLAFYLSDTWRPSAYFIPNGLLALILVLVQLTVGLVTVSNNQLVAILRRELLAYFYTPAAYLVLAGLAIIAAIQYLTWVGILHFAARDISRREVIYQEPVVQYYFYGLLPVFALLAIPPFLTMRLFSEEKRTATLEVLLVAPVSETTVVLGKFLGAWCFFLVAWGLWFVFPLIFRFLMGQPFDYRPMLSFYVGTAFLVMSFIGLGVFFSAITDNQVIAAVLSYAGVLALFVPQLLYWQFTWAGRGTGEWLVKLVQQLSLLQQYESFLQGQLYLQHLLYHISIAAFFLFLTVRVLESRKWK
ncbi:MAG: ABC transporter permease [Gemmatales bacterium]|nr:ABC transporter permease [Gemmatales bacterium]MDW8175378.1 ABC transporter permease [Gemmatales bacterium]